MKTRKYAKTLCLCVLALALFVSTASAVTSTLTASAYGGTQNSGKVTKTTSGNPSMHVDSISGMSQSYFWCRLRCGSSAATPAYKFTSTGSKNMYYLSGQGNVNDKIFVRIQTHADEPNAVTAKLTWTP